MHSTRDANFGRALLSRIEGDVIEGRTGFRLGGKELRASIELWAKEYSRKIQEAADTGPIFLALELTLESVLAYLGALASGYPVLTLDAKEWTRKGPELLDDLRPALCWLPGRLKDQGEIERSAVKVVQGIFFDASVHDEANAAKSFAPGAGDCPDAALVRLLAPTSGSTGRPAIVKITDRNLAANTRDIIAAQGLCARDCALLCLPLSYCFGASVLHTHLWAGGSVVVDDRLMFAEKVLDAIEQYGCTSFAGVPTSYTFLQHHSRVLERSFPTLKRWLQAGGYLAASVVHAFRQAHPDVAFMVMYGQTEATSRITTFTVEGDYPQGCVGYPMASLQVEVRLADTSQPCEIGREGEIWVRGESVSAGYLHDEHPSSQRFVSGWLNTGDLGYLLADGRLCVSGRAAGFIKIRGRRVGSQEVESLIWEQFSIQSCACPIPDPALGEVIGLYLSIERPDGKEAGELDGQWDERIRAFFPRHWDLGPVLCGRLPMTSNGKVDRQRCRHLLLSRWGGR
ncbi:class I adenylate-forming enzyme family protein [Castellaniella ginsengisoli]|uniref:Class I adenylate-forming enzyme family protein n=1 Tax=Castellaniella ginsengisoli TaxID=546114 RepID=A0AB39CWQ0_9BURK